MSLLKRIFGKKTPQSDDLDFWDWFRQHALSFYNVINSKDGNRINEQFIQVIGPRLRSIQRNMSLEVGIPDDSTAELDISAQGDIKTFVFVEELIARAPQLPNWKFNALKPAAGFDGMQISIRGHVFDSQTISFFYDDDPQYPDEIRITLVHQDYSEDNKKFISRGVLLFLESLLGELAAATQIDHVTVKGPSPENKPPIRMEKLADLLLWKEKEFVEKYQGVRHQTEADNYAALNGEDNDGLPLIAIVNQDLLNWDAKASHPWMMVIEIDFGKTKGAGAKGMPDDKYFDLMERFQDELTELLPDSAGYLDLGRKTYNGVRTIYLACKEFRFSSKKVYELIQAHNELDCTYDIYKDKYWRTMEAFRGNPE